MNKLFGYEILGLALTAILLITSTVNAGDGTSIKGGEMYEAIEEARVLADERGGTAVDDARRQLKAREDLYDVRKNRQSGGTKDGHMAK